MGIKIIVKGANFSAHAVSQSPNYEESLIGSSKTLWNNAGSTASAGAYGVLVPSDGYVSGIIIKSPSAASEKFIIRIYEKNSETQIGEYDVMPSPIGEGENEYVFTSPIPVEEDQVICIGGGSNAVKFYYASSGGDYPVSTSYGYVPESGWRIYTFDFVLQTES